MANRGVAISHLRTIYLEADETCLSLFEAPSALALQQASDDLDLGFVRIVEAVQVGAEDVVPFIEDQSEHPDEQHAGLTGGPLRRFKEPRSR